MAAVTELDRGWCPYFAVGCRLLSASSVQACSVFQTDRSYWCTSKDTICRRENADVITFIASDPVVVINIVVSSVFWPGSLRNIVMIWILYHAGMPVTEIHLIEKMVSVPWCYVCHLTIISLLPSLFPSLFLASSILGNLQGFPFNLVPLDFGSHQMSLKFR